MSNDIIGKRIKILYTDDRCTKLRTGDMGTITGVSTIPEGNRQIPVNWDNRSTLAMLEGIDKYKILDD
jgi:hypothetical protein